MKEQLNEESKGRKLKADTQHQAQWEAANAREMITQENRKTLISKKEKKPQQFNLFNASDPDRKICSDEKKEAKHRWLDQWLYTTPKLPSDCILPPAFPKMSLKIFAQKPSWIQGLEEGPFTLGFAIE